MTRLLIIGGGGHGAVVAEAAAEAGQWSEIAFLDDSQGDERILGFPLLGETSDLSAFLNDDTEIVIAIGDNQKRLEILQSVVKQNGALATVIHPTASISRSAAIAAGTVACAGVVVSARATVGRGCILNTAATIDHDCAIGQAAHISPGANLAGNVVVGERTWVGVGASVREGTNIGSDSIVGAGAAVVKDVADRVTVVGVPASVVGGQSCDV